MHFLKHSQNVHPLLSAHGEMRYENLIAHQYIDHAIKAVCRKFTYKIQWPIDYPVYIKCKFIIDAHTYKNRIKTILPMNIQS